MYEGSKCESDVVARHNVDAVVVNFEGFISRDGAHRRHDRRVLWAGDLLISYEYTRAREHAVFKKKLAPGKKFIRLTKSLPNAFILESTNDQPTIASLEQDLVH